MLRHMEKWLRRKRDHKQLFRVYLVVHGDYDLARFIEALKGSHEVKVVSGAETTAQTIDILIRPSALRALQVALPGNVLVSYETKTPEKC